MVYVALLRGINVGGKAKVEMVRLKAVFEALGCTHVLTYINSGNVVFCDDRSTNKLVLQIETAIKKEFGLDVPVVVRDQANIAKLCKEIPERWTNDTDQKTDVLFLWKEIDDGKVMEKVIINPAIEHAKYIDGAIVWNVGRKDVNRGGAIKLIKTNLYRHMTIRNINTVRKLHDLMRVY